MLASAQQLMYRLVQHPAFEVPECRFDTGHHDGSQADTTPEVAAAIHACPEFGDVIHSLPNQDGLEEFDDGGHDFRAKISRIGFPEPDQSCVRGDLDECRAAHFAKFPEKRVIRAWPGQQDGLDGGDFHEIL